MNQRERLRYLIDSFLKESDEYKDIAVPDDEEGQKRLLRSLMNVRMPGSMDAEALRVQDAYLEERIREMGAVSLKDISPAKGNMYIWQGDITRLSVDAIVNAANSQMLGCFVPMHSCIDNCIHTFAGVQLRKECDSQMENLRIKYGRKYEQPTAVPMITDAYNLPAKKVIHVVGPIVNGPLTKEHENLLAQCYTSCLDMAAENGLKSIAFCCISTGVFMFPNERAAEIAVETVSKWLDDNKSDMKVVFNVFKDIDLDIYDQLLGVDI